MLSPHEFATLMLVRSLPEQVDMTRAELDVLLDSQFIALEHGRYLRLTPAGERLLEATAYMERKLPQ
jgi:hypothetical protein